MIRISTVNGHHLVDCQTCAEVYQFLRRTHYSPESLIIKALGMKFVDGEIVCDRVAVVRVYLPRSCDVVIDTDFDRLAAWLDNSNAKVVGTWVQGEEIQ